MHAMATNASNQLLAQVQQALRQALLNQQGRIPAPAPTATIGSLGLQVNAGIATPTPTAVSPFL
jgi:hypothetical protein